MTSGAVWLACVEATASFVYDGDGKRVKGTTNGTTTIYIGNYFEWTGTITNSMRYYYAGSQRIAMRIGNSQDTTGLNWITSDHLGSTTVTADNNGNKYGELRYKAWGENRYTWGSTPTTYRYTGQREESGIGLNFYNARWYDTALGRFVQADTIVSHVEYAEIWDKYAYVSNNPVKFIDPTGHAECIDEECKLALHPISGNIISRQGKISIIEKIEILSGNKNPKLIELNSLGDIFLKSGIPIDFIPDTQNNVWQSPPPPPVSTTRFVAGTVLFGVLFVVGVSITVVGVGVTLKDPFGIGVVAVSLVITAFAVEGLYQTWRPLLPSTWPENLIVQGFKIP